MLTNGITAISFKITARHRRARITKIRRTHLDSMRSYVMTDFQPLAG